MSEGSKFPVEGMTVEPWGLPLMLSAWQGLVAFAAQNDEICAAFLAETGIRFGRTPFERMIDSATRHDKAVWAKFCDFVTVRLWGTDGDEDDEVEV